MTKSGWDSIIKALRTLDKDRDEAGRQRKKQERGWRGTMEKLVNNHNPPILIFP